jgi:hypothetical protein
MSALTITVPPYNTEKDVAFGVKLSVRYWKWKVFTVLKVCCASGRHNENKLKTALNRTTLLCPLHYFV